MKAEMEQEDVSSHSEPLLQPPPLQSTAPIDQEKGSSACCRICLESESRSPGDELISPCQCKGTQQFVHRECLDHWRSVKEGFAFSHCTTCKAMFHLRSHVPEDYSWRKLKFRLFVARDIIFIFLAVQATIAAFGVLAYLLDSDGQFRKSFNHGWDRVLSGHPVLFYYGAGVLILFVILGISGLVLHCLSVNRDDPYMAGGQHGIYYVGCIDCFPANGGDPGMAGGQHCCNCGGCVDCRPESLEGFCVLLVIFVVIFAILGIAYGLLAATVAFQRIWQRHYHILTKRELTKEYIVEDLNGHYTPPSLDPEHEALLKSLHLL